jgi:two-component system chemotaxis response regulator CheY
MRHVLVVDDSTVIRKIVRRVLEGMELEITEASDVRQALAVCSLSMPDAIFVDGGMPTLDGCEFLRKLRRMHGGDGPQAIICLNENDVAQIARAMHAGASDFMMSRSTRTTCGRSSPSSAPASRPQLRLFCHGRIVGDFRGGVRSARFP